jgi:signal peptidase I
MEPGLAKGDALLASPFPLGPDTIFGKLPAFSSPHRGDIVVFRRVTFSKRSILERIADGVISFFSFQKISSSSDGKRGTGLGFSVARVVGIPGDIIRMKDDIFEIKTPTATDYSDEFKMSGRRYDIVKGKSVVGDPFGSEMQEIQLGKGEYFVAGDNRTFPSGSILLGPIDRNSMYDILFMRYWPLKRIGGL